ncbi:hypothetical protein QAD02_020934 [Eretmocerus hayati]|uniref:Uncharacterized protein n=1 Tax=Eretmocerus hayati TaxID=131215 RepID=A0ACC2PQ41_9HYME|nr:hypothetical protein QAD02_020934 [Eretmocerus hayati]
MSSNIQEPTSVACSAVCSDQGSSIHHNNFGSFSNAYPGATMVNTPFPASVGLPNVNHELPHSQCVNTMLLEPPPVVYPALHPDQSSGSYHNNLGTASIPYLGPMVYGCHTNQVYTTAPNNWVIGQLVSTSISATGSRAPIENELSRGTPIGTPTDYTEHSPPRIYNYPASEQSSPRTRARRSVTEVTRARLERDRLRKRTPSRECTASSFVQQIHANRVAISHLSHHSNVFRENIDTPPSPSRYKQPSSAPIEQSVINAPLDYPISHRVPSSPQKRARLTIAQLQRAHLERDRLRKQNTNPSILSPECSHAIHDIELETIGTSGMQMPSKPARCVRVLSFEFDREPPHLPAPSHYTCPNPDPLLLDDDQRSHSNPTSALCDNALPLSDPSRLSACRSIAEATILNQQSEIEDPGPIPVELQQLSQSEIRLLSRIIPFVKIIKLSGRFGQFRFKGQAILFAQDVHEVTESLPTMLPRNSDQAGIIVITEDIENFNISREHQVDRDRLYKGLGWLNVNNPLYDDVITDHSVDLSEQSLVRLLTPRNPVAVDPQSESNYYRVLNEVSSILRVSWNYCDSLVFNPNNLGRQSCTMSLANIIQATIVTPDGWNVCEVDSNMLTGDRMYTNLKVAHDNLQQIPSPDKLSHITGLGDLRSAFSIFGLHSRVSFDDDSDFFGNLQSASNIGDRNVTLHHALTHLFNVDTAGPRARSDRGKACIIACDIVAELLRLCKRAFHPRNSEFALHHVTVHHDEEALVRNPCSQDAAETVICASRDSPSSNSVTSRPGEALVCNSHMTTSRPWRFVRATTHQGDDEAFASGYAGVQCCAMALASLAKGHISLPHRWLTTILDESLSEGDAPYLTIRSLTPHAGIGPTGSSQVRNFRVIKDMFLMFDHNLSIDYADDTDLFGDVRNDLNCGAVAFPLVESLDICFSNHGSCILIVGNSAYGLIKFRDRYYFTDSHSCNITGKSTSNGRACVIQCNTIQILLEFCNSKFGDDNAVYNLHHVDI